MNTTTNLKKPMAIGLGRALDARDHRNDLADKAYASLYDEMVDALVREPMKIVDTPGFNRSYRMTAADVINDDFGGRHGTEVLNELLRIVGLCAQGRVDGLKERACNWIEERAKKHATFHQMDLLDLWEGEE